MRDPLDPANPYLGKYAAYDLWIYNEAWSTAQGRPMDYRSQGEVAGKWYSLGVDSKGWPVPLKSDIEKQYREAADQQAGDVCTHSISAFGFMGLSMEQLMQQDRLAVQSAILPPVPQWLAELVPQAAMLLPGGEVITSEGHPSTPSGIHYRRYAADGSLLGETASDEWWVLLWPAFPQHKTRYSGSQWFESRGRVYRYDSQTGETRDSWDYFGNKGSKAAKVEPGYCEWIDGSELPEIYGNQSGDYRLALPAQGA